VGKIVGAVAVVRDITGEKLAERALIRQANLLELTHDAIFVWDFDGGITFWNKGAEKIYGYSKEEAIGKNNHQLLATKHPKGVAYIRSKLKSTGKWEGEIFHRTKDGKTIVIESKHVLVKERGRPAYVLETNRDITYRKEIEQRRNDFIALVSHELKTPLTSVKLYVQITKHILAKKHDGEHDKMIVKIERQLDRLTKLVQDMLTLVRMQKGKLEYSMKEIDLDAMIRETIEDMQLIYPKYRIINRLASNARVVGDYDRLNEVLVNIINNAVRYVEDKREILVGSELNGKCVKVWVQDYGMGIPKEAQKKIFTRFFRVESQVIQTYPGLGVGLYISSQIIKSHGGQIGVTSEVGSGSTFYFTLPVPSIQAS
jgi:PAS domain S-box-containing protein